MKSICFHCQFVGVGAGSDDSRCPQCSYPLITNMGGAQLASRDLERLFAHAAPRRKAPPLPGVSSEPRQAQLLMERRRKRAQALVDAKRQQDELEQQLLRSLARKRTLTSVFAASAALALGLLLTLNVFGAL